MPYVPMHFLDHSFSWFPESSMLDQHQLFVKPRIDLEMTMHSYTTDAFCFLYSSCVGMRWDEIGKILSAFYDDTPTMQPLLAGKMCNLGFGEDRGGIVRSHLSAICCRMWLQIGLVHRRRCFKFWRRSLVFHSRSDCSEGILAYLTLCLFTDRQVEFKKILEGVLLSSQQCHIDNSQSPGLEFTE